MITEDVVNNLLGDADATWNNRDAGELVLDRLTEWNPDPIEPGEPVAGDWVGSVALDKARGAFLARLDEVLAGESGCLLATHKFSSKKRAQDAVNELGSHTAVLLHETPLSEVHVLGKGLAPVPDPKITWARVALVIAVVLVLVLLVWLATQWLGRSGSN